MKAEKESNSLKNKLNQLEDYQREAVNEIVKKDHCILVGHQGTGKTWIVCGLIYVLKNKNPDVKALIICPLNSKESTWKDTLLKWGFKVTTDLSEYESCEVLLIHHEQLPKLATTIREYQWDITIYDESQKLRSRSSQQTRAIYKIRGISEKKLLLSGTPIDKHFDELWPSFKYLNPDILGNRWKDFEKVYMIKRDNPFRPGSLKFKQAERYLKPIFNEDKKEDFLSLIKPYVYVIGRDKLKVPKPIIKKINVRMWGRQKRIYEKMEKSSVVSKINLVGGLKAVKLIKLHQIISGWVINEDGAIVHTGLAKYYSLVRLLNTLDKPVVIFCRYKAEIEYLSDNLKAPTYSGNISVEERYQIQKKFQRGKIPILICQIKVGGVSIDLYKSHNVVFYSYWYSSIDLSQAISRVDRRGQRSQVYIYLLIVKDSIDEVIYKALTGKKSISENLKKYFNKKGH